MNEDSRKMPRVEDVETIQIDGKHLAHIVEVTEENREYLIDVAMSMYLNEPCRICGELIEEKHLNAMRFAGYSSCNSARSAHDECWILFEKGECPIEEWAFK